MGSESRAATDRKVDSLENRISDLEKRLEILERKIDQQTSEFQQASGTAQLNVRNSYFTRAMAAAKKSYEKKMA